MNTTKRFIFWFSKFLLDNLAHVEIKGTENIPQNGGAIVLINHLARADVPLFLYALNRQDITALVAKKYKSWPIIPSIVKALDAIWLDRKGSDVRAFRKAEEHIRAGRLMVISPEGTRSPTNALLKGKSGAAFLASRVNVPIIPAAMTGPEIAIPELLHFRKPHLTIRFGTPFFLDPVPRQERSRILDEYTDEIMCRIAVLLPEAYRGVYLNHPRLKEFSI